MRALLLLAFLAGCAAPAKDSIGPDKVVYHLNSGLEQASDGLRNIRNHLEVNPKAQIVVVVKRDQFIADATFVPSGVAEITRLQQREGYAYLRP